MMLTLNFIGASFTLLFALFAIVQPLKIGKLIALEPKGPRGISELRGTYGGWMLGLSAFTLWAQHPLVFQCLGIGWLGAALFRTSSFFLDGSYSARNLRFVIIEIIVGVFLLV